MAEKGSVRLDITNNNPTMRSGVIQGSDMLTAAPVSKTIPPTIPEQINAKTKFWGKVAQFFGEGIRIGGGKEPANNTAAEEAFRAKAHALHGDDKGSLPIERRASRDADTSELSPEGAKRLKELQERIALKKQTAQAKGREAGWNLIGEFRGDKRDIGLGYSVTVGAAEGKPQDNKLVAAISQISAADIELLVKAAEKRVPQGLAGDVNLGSVLDSKAATSNAGLSADIRLDSAAGSEIQAANGIPAAVNSGKKAKSSRE